MTLIKRKVVLTRESSSYRPRGAYSNEEYLGRSSPDLDPRQGVRIAFHLDEIAEMGNPETITVTIEPGDTLNEGEAS